MKKRIPIVKFALFLIFALLTCFLLISCGSEKSDVQLTGISGGTLSTLPEGVSELSLPSDANRADFTFLRAEEEAQKKLQSGEIPYNTKFPHEIELPADTSFSAVAQTVVLFDEAKYASITIKLDNPYEYYVCDFYMTCSQPDAMIYVDDEWLPLDGSVKIRWTGSTNRKATYTVYLPTVEAGATVSVKDMRYLNEKEIAIDLNAHDVANVYRMVSPIRTEFVVNTPEFFLFKVIESENCTSFTVEGATYDENEGAYKMTADGTYTVKYTYTIPGTELVGEGEIVSEEIQLLRVYIQTSPYAQPFYVNDSFIPTDFNTYYGTICHIGGINFAGTGLTFHKADIDDVRETHFQGRYFCDNLLTVSVNGSEFGEAFCVESNANGSDRYGWMYVKLDSPPADYDVETGNAFVDGNFEVKWNGYTIYSGEWTSFG